MDWTSVEKFENKVEINIDSKERVFIVKLVFLRGTLFFKYVFDK